MSAYTLIDIVITFILFMVAPFIRFYKNKGNYTYEEKKKFIIINSVVVQIIFVLIIDLLSEIAKIEPNYNITPAFLYYFVNQAIWNKKNKTIKEENKNDEK